MKHFISRTRMALKTRQVTSYSPTNEKYLFQVIPHPQFSNFEFKVRSFIYCLTQYKSSSKSVWQT